MTQKTTKKQPDFSFNIVLIGFMGCGKSTVARALSSAYNMEIMEMDEIIAQRENMSIPDIFSTYGEEYFRRLETNLLKELQTQKHKIISCGGGAALRAENVAEMRKNGKIFLLTASPETILERVKQDNSRPVLKGRKTAAGIAELMEQRREKYEAAADVVINTDNKNISDICTEIIRVCSGSSL